MAKGKDGEKGSVVEGWSGEVVKREWRESLYTFNFCCA